MENCDVSKNYYPKVERRSLVKIIRDNIGRNVINAESEGEYFKDACQERDEYPN